jgi:hypothetical protein
VPTLSRAIRLAGELGVFGIATLGQDLDEDVVGCLAAAVLAVFNHPVRAAPCS